MNPVSESHKETFLEAYCAWIQQFEKRLKKIKEYKALLAKVAAEMEIGKLKDLAKKAFAEEQAAVAPPVSKEAQKAVKALKDTVKDVIGDVSKKEAIFAYMSRIETTLEAMEDIQTIFPADLFRELKDQTKKCVAQDQQEVVELFAKCFEAKGKCIEKFVHLLEEAVNYIKEVVEEAVPAVEKEVARRLAEELYEAPLVEGSEEDVTTFSQLLTANGWAFFLFFSTLIFTCVFLLNVLVFLVFFEILGK